MQNGRKMRLLQGSEAVVEGAIAAGVRFFAGYPITPSTEILEGFSQRLPEVGGTFIQMEDELGSLTAVLGASVGGVKAMTATSGLGAALMQEIAAHAISMEIPCVIVDVQRMGPGLGLIFTAQGDTMFAKWGTPGGNEIIALAPSSVKEVFELTIKAVNLSERFRVPVYLLSDAYMAHMREKVEVVSYDQVERVERSKPVVPPEEYLTYDAEQIGVPAWADFGSKYRPVLISSTHDKAGRYSPGVEDRRFLNQRLHNKILGHLDEILMNEEIMLEDAQLAVFAYGICARGAKAAVMAARAEGVKVGLLRPITLWPFPTEAVIKLSRRVKRILVVEMNYGQLVREVKSANKGNAEVNFLGEDVGQLIRPGVILSEIRKSS
jgi:2-oxoglutarate ferredoxin oxidoreductase subunit alpha